MWRNFRNVGSAMQAIGNVVAPPVDDDDDEGSYYDDDEEGEEEGEEEELDEADDINSQDNDPQWRQNHEAMDQVQSERVSPLKAGFGFVGMIARALDRGEEEEDDDEEYYEDEDDGQEVVELYRDETANEMQQIIPTNDEIDGMKSSTPPPPPEETQISQQQPSREEGDGWDDIHTTWTTNESLTQNDAENGSQMEKRPSIQRETGSVSPVSPSRKNVHSPSPNNAPSNSVEASNLGNVESLQSRLPDLLIEQPSNESADIPDEPQQIDKAEEERPDISNNISLAKYEQKLSMDSQEQPETEAPVSESNSQAPEISGGSPAVSSQDSAIYKEKRRGSYKFESDEKPQIRRSSKVSLSDARFLAEPPRADELETVDRWAAPKSTSIRQKGRTSSKDNNNIVSSRHSLDSYFDDSSLSSVSSHNRVGKRKEQGRGTKSDQQIHLSASSPALASNSNPAKVDRAQITATEAEDRFRAEPVRPSADDLPTRDTRFVSTRSHVSPPPEPQRQASRRQWSQGSSKNKADAINANIIEAGRNKADFETVVTGPAGSMIPPRNPRRTQSTEEESSVPEVDPKVNSRPPLVAGNSRDADVLPRRPVQRMHSLTEENTNQEDLDTSGSALDITGTSNGVRPLVSGEKMQASEVEKRCIELENQLREMTEAKQMFEEKFKQEEASREALLYAFQEKEARLFNANAEENEQVVRELTAEMERRVGEISSLLEDQQRQHESERAEWQEMLKEAEDQLNAIGEGDDTTEQVSRLLEDQQRQHENDRAEWQELLSQAEEEIEKLKKQKGKNDLDISEHVSSLMEDQERQHESDRAEWQRLLNETEEQLELARKENREFQAKLENSTVRNQQRYDRDLRIAEDKLAQTMALLDEREEQIVQLKNMVKSMSAEVNEHREGVQEVEDEADELRHQTEVLQHRLDTKTAECSELHEELTKLQSEVDRMANLKMELRLLKEDRERERAKSQSVAENASSNSAKLSTERDAALAEVGSLRQQLAAAQADIEIAQQDAARAQKASENLQMALESIQSEREAELALLEEQRRSLEESTAAAHAAALEATHEANEARIREVRAEAHLELLGAKAEIKKLEEKLESFRTENVQMRRSLDEAIGRLQHNQEDVIDRTLMKNILLDWLTKSGSKEKREILELMASVLHFTEEEKGRVHIGGEVLSLGKVVATVAAPPPPPKADVGHLQGSNVREKWVNFLMAETED